MIAVVLLLWTSPAARKWRSTWSTWDWVGFFVLAIGVIIVFSASVGAFSQSWLISTGYYRHRMIVYGLWAVGAFTDALKTMIAPIASTKNPTQSQVDQVLRHFRAAGLVHKSRTTETTYTTIRIASCPRTKVARSVTSEAATIQRHVRDDERLGDQVEPSVQTG